MSGCNPADAYRYFIGVIDMLTLQYGHSTTVSHDIMSKATNRRLDLVLTFCPRWFEMFGSVIYIQSGKHHWQYGIMNIGLGIHYATLGLY